MTTQPSQKFTMRDLQRQMSDVQFAAMKEPVGLTQHGKTRFVLLSLEAYQQLLPVEDPQAVYLTAEAPETIFTGTVAAEIARIIGSESGDNR
jgi:hypothetical protein